MIDTLVARLKSLDLVVDANVSNNDILVSTSHVPPYVIRLADLNRLPYKLPSATLENLDTVGVRPHVSWSGVICVSDGEAINIDHRFPEDVAAKYLEDAIAVLDSHEPDDLSQFWDEFEGYWNAQKTDTVYFVGDPPDKCTELRVKLNKRGRVTAVVELASVARQIGGFKRSVYWGQQEIVGYYCPLKTNVVVPEPQTALRTDDLERALSAMALEDREFIDKALRSLSAKRKDSKSLVLVFGQSRPRSGSVSLFGVSVPSGVKYLTSGITNYKRTISALRLLRFGDAHLSARASSERSLGEHTFAVVGCGAVGARISELLLQCGARSLALVDFDLYEADNVFRHILPSSEIGKSKAEALAEHLEEKYPFVDVTAYQNDVASPGALKEVLGKPPDVLVVAIGQPSLERMLNEEAYAPVTLFSWLEPLGLGGHSIVRDSANGCLECLYRKENTPSLEPVCSFLAPGQTVSRNLTGCAGAFIPFSALDAAKTACMAMDLLVDGLSRGEFNQKYRCWTGDNSAATRVGITTSPWFAEVRKNGQEAIDQTLDNGCSVCSGGDD